MRLRTRKFDGILIRMGRRSLLRMLIAALLAFMPPISIIGESYAQMTPTRMTFQGRLTDSSSNPLAGTHNFVFEVYDASTDGNQLWTETQNGVTVVNGVLSAQLGSVTPLTAGVFAGPSIRVDEKTGM